MKRFIDTDVENYAERFTPKGPSPLPELEVETREKVAMPQMLSGHLEGRFLSIISALCKPKNILEIGTYVGFSALCMAEHLPDDGKLITCDINSEFVEIAKNYWKKSPHGHKIESRLGPALETIKTLDVSVDLAFIDADKENYKNYYDAILPKLSSGGIIVVDNCLWSGRVLKPNDPGTVAIHELNEFVSRDDRVENVILTLRDGVNLIRKK